LKSEGRESYEMLRKINEAFVFSDRFTALDAHLMGPRFDPNMFMKLGYLMSL